MLESRLLWAGRVLVSAGASLLKAEPPLLVCVLALIGSRL